MLATAALILAVVSQPAPTRFLSSLPRVQGRVEVAGLAERVTVERDAFGVAAVSGEALLDVVRGQGFVHGQERFFQMDFTRRLVSGRLAEAVGADAINSDRAYRHYRFERVADEVVRTLPPEHRALLEAYAEGVNAGVAALGAPPPELALLGVEPEPWSARSGIVVLLAMYDVLHRNERIERPLGVMAEALPPELVAFLTPVASRFDALLDSDGAAAPPPPIPGPDVLDLRGQAAARLPRDLVEVSDVVAGSNSWAVAGSRTTHGQAIVANDPHLLLTAPGIWHRVELTWRDDAGAPRTAGGVSLPGVPGVVIGATGDLAWGFTNTGGDFQDLVVVLPDPDDADRYLGPVGPEAYGAATERIDVRGGDPVDLELRTTRWGVVTDTDWHGRPLVLRWTALDADAVDLGQLELLSARTLEEGVAAARAWRGPSQNVVLADATGRIAWTVSGWFPRRVGFDGTVPVAWTGGVGWDGALDEALRPEIVDPPGGLLYTANNRTVGADRARRLGNGWSLGARARRIRDLLDRDAPLDERDLLAIQLDARVEVFDFYRDLALAARDGAAGTPDLAAACDALRAWDGTAGVDQAAVRLLDRYRRALHGVITGPLVAPCRTLDPFFRYSWSQGEEVVRRLLEARPAHLLPPGHADWPALARETLRRVYGEMAGGPGPLAPWGDVHRANVAHPLADGAPAFAAMLNMPAAPLPGHPLAVRVAGTRFGASARMVVSPARPDDGILHIPAGQSGHPLSPDYRSSHDAWLEGRPTPFRPSGARRRLVLAPPAD